MKKKGFTIIELLVVVAVIVIVFSTFAGIFGKAGAAASSAHKALASVPDAPAAYITDAAGVMPEAVRHELNEQLAAWDSPQGGQLLVYVGTVLPEGQDVEAFSHNLFRKWRPGDKRKNSGILLVIFTQSRKMRIHTGYGMEGSLPDAVCKQILADKVRPFTKENNWAGAVRAAIHEIMAHASKSSAATDGADRNKPMTAGIGDTGSYVIAFLSVLTIALIVSVYELSSYKKRILRQQAEVESRLRSAERQHEADARYSAIQIDQLKRQVAQQEVVNQDLRAQLSAQQKSVAGLTVQPDTKKLPAKPQVSESKAPKRQMSGVGVASAAAVVVAAAGLVSAVKRVDPESDRKERERRNKEAEDRRQRQEEEERAERARRDRKRREEEEEESRNRSSLYSSTSTFSSTSDYSSSSDSSPSCGGGDSGGGGASSDC